MLGKRDLATFAPGGFRTGDKEQFTEKVDMLPALVQKLASAHARMKARDDHLSKVRCRRREEFLFFLEADHRARS